MARFRQGDVKLKTSQKITLGDSDEGTIQYDTDAVKITDGLRVDGDTDINGQVQLEEGVAVNRISDNSAIDSTSSLMTSSAVQKLVEDSKLDNITDSGDGIILNEGVAVNNISNNSNSDSTSAIMTTSAIQNLVDSEIQLSGETALVREDVIAHSTKGVEGLFGIENVEFAEENSFSVAGTNSKQTVKALPNGNIASLTQTAGNILYLEIHTPDGTRVNYFSVLSGVSSPEAHMGVLQNGYIVCTYISGGQARFRIFDQEGDQVIGEQSPQTSIGGVINGDPNIQPLFGGRFMFYGSQYNIALRVAVYEMVAGSLSTIIQLFDVLETSGVTNAESSALLADGNIALCGYNNVAVSQAIMVIDKFGQEVTPAVGLGVDSVQPAIVNLPSKRIAALVRSSLDPYLNIYDYELNLIDSYQLSVNLPSAIYGITVLQNGKILVAFGDGTTKEGLAYIFDEQLNLEQSIVVATSTTACYIDVDSLPDGGFVALAFVNSAITNLYILKSSKTRINGSLGLENGVYVDTISDNSGFDSTSALMTSAAIQDLVTSEVVSGVAANAWRNHDIVVVESDTALTVGDGKRALTIPVTLNGRNLTAKVASVHTLGSDATGGVVIQIRRRRAGSDVNMLSTPMIIGDDEYYSTAGTIDTSNDDVATGDQIYIDIDSIPEFGTAPSGLSVTLTFN